MNKKLLRSNIGNTSISGQSSNTNGNSITNSHISSNCNSSIECQSGNNSISSQSSSASSSVVSSPNDYAKQISDNDQHGKSLKIDVSATARPPLAAQKHNFKDSGLESGETSDTSDESNRKKHISKSTPSSISNVNSKPAYEMKIQSALASSILQQHKGGVLTKTKPFDSKQQMVSVLKKPPQQQQLRPNESIVTTINSSNDEVHNIIVQPQTPVVNEKSEPSQPPRKKLNLAEYRSRRENTGIENVPTALLYTHHASTSTEPISSEQQIWCEREIVPVFKSKTELEQEKNKPKPSTRIVGIQTIISVFGVLTDEKLVDIEDQTLPKDPRKLDEPVVKIKTENLADFEEQNDFHNFASELNNEPVSIKTEPIEEGEIEDEDGYEEDTCVENSQNDEPTQVIKPTVEKEIVKVENLINAENEEKTQLEKSSQSTVYVAICINVFFYFLSY